MYDDFTSTIVYLRVIASDIYKATTRVRHGVGVMLPSDADVTL